MTKLWQTALWTLAFVGLTTSMGMAQWGSGMRNGSYRDTCQDIRTNGDRIEARCQDSRGNWRKTSINSSSCNGDIVNDNGNLRCRDANWQGGGGPWQNNGQGWRDYRESCRDIRVNGDRIDARCRTLNGDWNTTSLDNADNCRGMVVNDNGNLRCVNNRGGGWRGSQGRWPSGQQQYRDFRETCQNVRQDGNRLRARCRTEEGRWRDTTLDDVNSCRGQIVNDDGHLRCDNNVASQGPWGGWGGGRGWRGGLPWGDYRQTCQNVRMDGDRLRARCQTRDGRWRDTSLDDANRCRGRIVNDDGHLQCQ